MTVRRLATVVLSLAVVLTAHALFGAPSTGYEPVAVNERLCPSGQLRCVDDVAGELAERTAALACDHAAVFSLIYLRMTEQVGRSLASGTFDDPAAVAQEDAVFAGAYLSAWDRWSAGRLTSVPPAWRAVFDAGTRGALTGNGDAMTAIAAHVRRDLPFVLAAVSGVSRADHDRIDAVLHEVFPQVVAEISARYDPTVALDDPLTVTHLDDATMLTMFDEWRARAWDDAQALRAAATNADRAVVADGIERRALATVQTLAAANSDLTGLASVQRDAYCAAHLS